MANIESQGELEWVHVYSFWRLVRELTFNQTACPELAFCSVSLLSPAVRNRFRVCILSSLTCECIGAGKKTGIAKSAFLRSCGFAEWSVAGGESLRSGGPVFLQFRIRLGHLLCGGVRAV